MKSDKKGIKMKQFMKNLVLTLGILGFVISVAAESDSKTNPTSSPVVSESNHQHGSEASATTEGNSGGMTGMHGMMGKHGMMAGKMNMADMHGMMMECMKTSKLEKMCSKKMMKRCEKIMGKNECQKMMEEKMDKE